MQFPWRWTSGTISTNSDVIWGMSVEEGVEVGIGANIGNHAKIEADVPDFAVIPGDEMKPCP